MTADNDSLGLHFLNEIDADSGNGFSNYETEMFYLKSIKAYRVAGIRNTCRNPDSEIEGGCWSQL